MTIGRSALACALAFGLALGGNAQTFTPLGPQVTVASGVSTDGRTVVGWGGSDPFYRAVKWVDGVVTQLPIGPDDTISYAYAVSPDGQHITGGSGRMVVIFDALEAVRWSGAGLTMTRLGLLPDTSSTVGRGISDDGNTIVGVATAPTEFGLMNMQAFRWRTGGMTRLAPAAGFDWAAALSVSRAGDRAVGFSRSSGFGPLSQHATLWNSAGVPTDLGVPAGFTTSSASTIIQSHYEFVAGEVSGPSGTMVARYSLRSPTGWEPLPPLGSASNMTFGAAAWSSVDLRELIVGTAFTTGSPDTVPFGWTQTRGTFNLQEYLIAHGAAGMTGWTKVRPTGATLGMIVGTGVNPLTGRAEGWLAAVPGALYCRPNCNGDETASGAPVLDIRDFICFQNKIAVGDQSVDCNRDGTLDILDFTCFQGQFALGCG